MNIFWSMADSNETKFKNAERICRVLGITIKEEDFRNIRALTRDSEENNYDAKSIIIELDNYNIEVIILEDRYFLVKKYDEYDYQFVKQYMYEDNFLLEESFSLGVDDETFVNLTECYPSSYLIIENDEKMIMRSHTQDGYVDFKSKSLFGMKDFINEIKEGDNYEFKEVVNFLDKDSLYYINVRKNPEVGMFLGGATLDVPQYNISVDESEKEEGMLLKSLGMTEGRTIKHPKINIFGSYQNDDTIHTFEIDILKNDQFIFLRVVNDKKDSNMYKIRNVIKGAISIEEIRYVRNCLFDILKDKEYQDWVITYFDELLYRTIVRRSNDLKDINTFDSDIFDYYVLEGKDINGDEEGKPIEERALDLFIGRDRIPRLLDNVSIEPLRLNKEKEVLKV